MNRILCLAHHFARLSLLSMALLGCVQQPVANTPTTTTPKLSVTATVPPVQAPVQARRAARVDPVVALRDENV